MACFFNYILFINNNLKHMIVNNWKIVFYILIILFIFGVGFYIGRKTIEVKEKETIEYIKGDTIKGDTIFKPIPKYINLPIDTLNIIQQCIKDGIYRELWPTKTITEYIEIEKEDTTKIIEDWGTKRFYSEMLFNNDTIGTCIVNAQVQYNRLRFINYEFEPLTKKVVQEKYLVKRISPFIGGGIMVNPWDEVRNPVLTLSGGVFINEKYGLQVNVMRFLKSKNDYVGGTFLYKF